MPLFPNDSKRIRVIGPKKVLSSPIFPEKQVKGRNGERAGRLKSISAREKRACGIIPEKERKVRKINNLENDSQKELPDARFRLR